MRRNAFAMLTRRAHEGSAEKSGALCLECINDEGGSVTLSKVGSLASDLYFRTNSSPKWTAYTAGTAVSLAKGDWVEFENRADCTYSTDDHHQFSMTGEIAASGEVRSMINWAETLADYCYYLMFYGCTSLTAAPELPATTLANYCYSSMFYGCTSLTAAPELPATTLKSDCYSSMFYGCTSLTAAPELPATTLKSYCYSGMFYDCTSLTAAPELPATTLANGCYSDLFLNCISLTAAPKLPATTLADYCYYLMFYGCTSLTAAPELPATTLANYCYYRMFYGCTSLTAAPELPATTLKSYCYSGMFYDCTSLTAAPELPATTLANYCYYRMFYGCTAMSSVKVSFTAWSTLGTIEWLSGVSSTGTFTCPYALGTADTITRGVSNCPTGWDVVNPDAPATTVAFTVSGLTADSSPSGDLSVYMGDYEVDGTTTYNGTAYTRYKLAGGAYYLAHCAITSHWGFSTKAEPSTPSDCDMYGYFSTTSPTEPTAAQLQSLSWTDASGVLLSMTFK